MNIEEISVKTIITAIEEYYSGKQIELIYEEHQIGQAVFDNWLINYKQITLELMELKLENEQLRKMFIDLSFKHQFAQEKIEDKNKVVKTKGERPKNKEQGAKSKD